MTASTVTKVLEDVAVMCDAITNEWNVTALESGRENGNTLSIYSVGRRYIKIVRKVDHESPDRTGYVYMFVDRVSGNCYSVKSWNQADKLVRGTVTNFIENPHMCSVYGSFAYLPRR